MKIVSITLSWELFLQLFNNYFIGYVNAYYHHYNGRSVGNPTRDALQNQIAILEGTENAKSFCFTTGMAALTTIGKLACSGDEIIVNDDSYGGTYRLMSKVCSRQGIKVIYQSI